MPLTDAAVRNAKPGTKPLRLWDSGGLYLEVSPAGGKLWRLKYRFGGKEKRLALGAFPAVGLARARERRDEARRMLAEGVEPMPPGKVRAGGIAPEPGTFEAIAREWLTTVHVAAVSPGTAERTRIRFEQDAFPWIGRRPIAAIEPPELLTVLRRVVARGAVETAHRLKDSCGQVFRYSIAVGASKRNPAADLRGALPPVVSKHFAALVEPRLVSGLLCAMADYRGAFITRCALGLSALLLLRPGELRQLEWPWIDWETATLTVPPALMKRGAAGKVNGAPHIVPLARQAVAILRELQPLTGRGRYVFSSLHTGTRPMSENTTNFALRRMGFGREVATAHGFRAMARTMAVERLGIDPAVIEAQLGHAVPDALGRAYNRTSFLDQRRDAMQRWADYLDRLREGAEIVPIRGAA
jgi:integrase